MAYYLFLGPLNRDFILPPRGKPLVDVLGGAVAYAAAGAALWGAEVGLVSRVGEDFPQEWLHRLQAQGWDTSGVQFLTQPIETRRVHVYDTGGNLTAEQPIQAFIRRRIPPPKSLLNYLPPSPQRAELERPSPQSLRQGDLPANAAAARGAHFCPHDFPTHHLLPAVLRAMGVPFISLTPPTDYMGLITEERLAGLVAGLDALIVTENALHRFFRGTPADLWEIAAILRRWRAEHVLIRRANGETWLYRDETHRWIIPAYPAPLHDPTGREDAFAGAFLVNLRETLDPVRAAVCASVTAAAAAETRGVFALLETLPELLKMRAEALMAQIHTL